MWSKTQNLHTSKNKCFFADTPLTFTLILHTHSLPNRNCNSKPKIRSTCTAHKICGERRVHLHLHIFLTPMLFTPETQQRNPFKSSSEGSYNPNSCARPRHSIWKLGQILLSILNPQFGNQNPQHVQRADRAMVEGQIHLNAYVCFFFLSHQCGVLQHKLVRIIRKVQASPRFNPTLNNSFPPSHSDHHDHASSHSCWWAVVHHHIA